jgi:hypothetical protein
MQVTHVVGTRRTAAKPEQVSAQLSTVTQRCLDLSVSIPNAPDGKETLMSKGPGHVSRAIEAALEAEPDNAFTIEDLCDRVYRGVNRVEKKHRVAVLRAAKAIVARCPDFDCMTGEGLGGTLVIFNRYRVMSYAMAWLKADRFERYRSNDKRNKWRPPAWYCKGLGWGPAGKGKVWVQTKRNATEADLRAQLESERHRKLMAPGGAWWRQVQIWIAERDGDAERVAQLEAEREQALANLTADHTT